MHTQRAPRHACACVQALSQAGYGAAHTLKRRLALHTALLHLKPLPKPSCQMRSPRFMPPNISWYASTYLNGRKGGEGREGQGTGRYQV